MNPRPKKFIAAFVGAVAAITMMGAGSAAAKTPPPKPPLVTAETASMAGRGSGSETTVSPTPYSSPAPKSFKPR